MNEYTLTKKIYYIAVQDGRLDNREFLTYHQAEQAREEIRKTCEMSYRSTYITFYNKKIKFEDLA